MFFRTRMKIFLIFATIAFIIAGFAGIGNALKYRSPVTLTYAQLVQQHPMEGWFTVTDGYLDLSQSVIPTNLDERAYYVPLRVDGLDPKELDVVVYVSDPDLVDTIDSYNNKAGRTMTEWGMQHMGVITAIQAPSDIPMAVSGMISQKVVRGSEEYEKIQNILNTNQDFGTILLNRQPSLLKSLGLIVMGLILGIAALWSFGIQPDLLLRGGHMRRSNDSNSHPQSPNPYPVPNLTAQSPYSPSYPSQVQSPYPPSYPPQTQGTYPPSNTSPNPYNRSAQSSAQPQRPSAPTPAQWPYGIPGTKKPDAPGNAAERESE